MICELIDDFEVMWYDDGNSIELNRWEIFNSYSLLALGQLAGQRIIQS